ncbi:hypothetical protein BCR44DRAFT_33579, partial [Catenaria anguillulae PL171]
MSDDSVAAVQIHCPDSTLAPTLVFRGSATTIGRCLPFHQAIIDTLPKDGSDAVVSRSHIVIRATDLGALVERVGRNPSYYRAPNVAGQDSWSAIPMSVPMLIARPGHSAVELALIYDELAREYRHIFHIRILTGDDVRAHENVHSADQSALAGASSVSKIGKPNQMDGEVWQFSSQAMPGSQVGDTTVTMQRAIINKPRVNPFQQSAASASGTTPILLPNTRPGVSTTDVHGNNTDDDSTTDDSDREHVVSQHIASQTSQQPNLVRMQTLHAPITRPRPTATTSFRSRTATGSSDLGADEADGDKFDHLGDGDEQEEWEKMSSASDESDLFPEPVEMYEMYARGMVPLYALVPPPDLIAEEEKRRSRKSQAGDELAEVGDVDAKRVKV